METQYVYSSIKGTSHKRNEDNYLVIDDQMFSVFVVFDGVSSALHGKESTQEAKKYIECNYFKYLGKKTGVKHLMFDLNKHLCNIELSEPYTTYCLFVFDKERKSSCYSWLGDSRLYLITNQFVELLTDDDSISENIITKYLGNSSLNLNDFRQVEFDNSRGNFLLCTDGFYKLFESNKLAFFDTFLKRRLSTVKDRVNALVKGNNYDDSTFIFIKSH